MRNLLVALLMGKLWFWSGGFLPVFAAQNSRWMTALDDQKSVAELSIPGTHDSGATREFWPGTSQCQRLTLGEQLEAGVRYLDIRCRRRNGRFAIFHREVDQHLSFDQVVEVCLDFLRQNPGESLLMSVKEESGRAGADPSQFETLLEGYIAAHPERWYLGSNLPTLAMIRGKIVLLRRFAAQHLPKGIDLTDWADNANSMIPCGPTQIQIQDQYMVNRLDLKWQAIHSGYQQARGSNPGWLFINFASGYQVSRVLHIPRIQPVVHFVNPLLKAFFVAAPPARYGVTVLDFADPKLCSLIIATNF